MMALKDIDCENWVKLGLAKPLSGGKMPPSIPPKFPLNL